jgi:hypothetical protein
MEALGLAIESLYPHTQFHKMGHQLYRSARGSYYAQAGRVSGEIGREVLTAKMRRRVKLKRLPATMEADMKQGPNMNRPDCRHLLDDCSSIIAMKETGLDHGSLTLPHGSMLARLIFL